MVLPNAFSLTRIIRLSIKTNCHICLPCNLPDLIVMHLPYGFTITDALAFMLFIVVWVSHYYVINHSRWRVYTITAAMTAMREKWMLNVVVRGDSPIDAIIQTGLQQGVLFFASTTVLLIGGLVAVLGASETGVAVLQGLPMVNPSNTIQMELKILLIILIFVMAFFKFAWSHRLYNYILIMIGAAPNRDTEEQALTHYAKKLSLLHALASKHFTTGLNAYFLAMAAFAWLVSAWLFMVATVWVALVLYRRAFRADFLLLLRSKVH